MTLFTIIIDSKRESRQFCTDFIGVEEALDFLQTFSKFGDRVIGAYIIESDGNSVEIPLEILDEETDSSPLQQLRRQWELALKTS